MRDWYGRQDQKMIDRAREIRKERQKRECEPQSSYPEGVQERRNDGMIKVIRLNGEALYINFFQIEYLESIPETKIKMMNGNYYLVKDTVDSIIERTKEFVNGCITFQKHI